MVSYLIWCPNAPPHCIQTCRTERILPRKFLSASTHRHEVLCCLLDSLQRTERAEEAARICIESTLVAAKDLKHQDPYPKPSDPSSHTPVGGSSSRGHHEIDGLGFASLSSREARASAWLRMTRTVLQATLLCLSWEPVITPAITTQPSNEAQGRAPADFCSAPSDLWLKLFGAASQCARALGETLSVRLTPDQRLQRGGPDSDPSLILPPQGQGRLHEATPQVKESFNGRGF